LGTGGGDTGKGGGVSSSLDLEVVVTGIGGRAIFGRGGRLTIVGGSGGGGNENVERTNDGSLNI